MKTLLFVPILFSLVACNATKTEEVTTGGVVTSSTPHIWSNQTFPKTIYISEDFDLDEYDNMVDMAAKWDVAVEGKKNFFTVSSTRVTEKTDTISSSDNLKDSLFAVYKVRKWPKDLTNALAVTQMFGVLYNYGESDEYYSVVHADILVNYSTWYNFYSDDSKSGYDLRTVVLHEMGHFIGLNHQSVPKADKAKTVMYPSISGGEEKRTPQPLDQVTLASQYNITLSSSSGSSQMTTARKEYKPRDAGTEVKMQIELYPDGECVHRMNGKVVNRHPASLK